MKEYIQVLEFTSGQRISIFTETKDRALQRNVLAVAELAERGLVHDRRTRDVDNRWAQRNKYRMYTPKATEIDNLVDPVLVSIRDIAHSHTRGLPEGHALSVDVEAMLSDVYPAGVAALVSLPYHDQVAATELVLKRLQTTHSALVAKLGLGVRVALLAELTAKYREEVSKSTPLRYAEVQAMHAQGQILLRELIALILGLFHDSRDPDQVALRTELLEPVARVTALVRMRRARRRPEDSADADADADAPTDADEQPADESPADAGAGAAERTGDVSAE